LLTLLWSWNHGRLVALHERTGKGNLHLRVLIANERLDRLDLLGAVVEGLGHTVVERAKRCPR
jgi:hypothetical protein